MSTPNASFNGVVSLRTREEVITLIDAVARLVTVGNIFQNLQNDSQSWRPLLQDVIIISNSAASFYDICIDPEGKEKTNNLLQGIEQSKRTLGQLFLNLNGRFPSFDEQNNIIKEFQNVLLNMAEITDVMEEDQVFRIKRAAKLSFQHVMILRETTSDYRFDPKVQDFRNVNDNFMQCLDNRLNVLPDSPLKQDITNARYDISENIDNYINSTRYYIMNLSNDALLNRDAVLEPIILGIKTIIELIGDTLTKGNCSFQHEQILNDLDKLTDAVKHGSTSDAAGSARLLVDELNKMKATMEEEPDNSELNDSCNRLSEMTQRLLAATRDALTSNTDEKTETLAATVDDVKDHIIQVANIEKKSKKSNDLRMQLLQAAQNMTTDMNGFVATLSNA